MFVLCRVTVIVLIWHSKLFTGGSTVGTQQSCRGFVTVGVWVAVLLVCVFYAAVTVSAK